MRQGTRSTEHQVSRKYKGTRATQRKGYRTGFIGAAILGVLLAAAPAQAQTPVVEAKNVDDITVLEVNQNGGLLMPGVLNRGIIPAEGSGTRLMWHPAKAAFRAGGVGVSSDSDGTEWDDANVGPYSVAFGRDAKASGEASTAIGWGTTARDDRSTAIGTLTTASNFGSTAIGLGTTASGENSTAMGSSTTAGGAMSTAMGSSTTAGGFVSTAMGWVTTASGENSTAMGYNTTASGETSTAMGYKTTAQAFGSLVIGQNNIVEGDPDAWLQADPLFVAGNGSVLVPGESEDEIPSNALTLLKNGNLTIAGDLSENSDRRLKTDIAPLGDVLAALEGIEPVRYRFREGTNRPAGPQLGLIAQEVEQAFPELVTHGGDGYLSVAYPKLTAVLLGGLQEQQNVIEAQRKEIAAMQAENTTIQHRLAALEARVQDDGSVLAGWSGWGAAGLFALLILGGVFVRRFGS